MTFVALAVLGIGVILLESAIWGGSISAAITGIVTGTVPALAAVAGQPNTLPVQPPGGITGAPLPKVNL